MKLLLATNNSHKAEELQMMLNEEGFENVELYNLSDFPFISDPPETCDTFSGNALQKARFVYDALLQSSPAMSETIVLADDSGLVVPSLNGEPGVRSKRYTPEATPSANNAKLLRVLRGSEDRTAHFVCALALVTPAPKGSEQSRIEETVEGRCHGYIARGHKGENGFGYDPIFVPQVYAPRHMAELTPLEKNTISHRGNALRQLPEMLRSHLERPS